MNSVRYYKKLSETYQIDEILKDTANYKKYENGSKKYPLKMLFRVKSLLTIGKFAEAELLCHEALANDCVNENQKQIFTYYLFSSYFYREKYITCLDYVGPLLDEEYMSEDVSKALFFSILADGSEKAYDEFFKVDKSILMSHILGRHSTEINLDVDVLYDLIVANFNKTPAYYTNFRQFRVFRCFNAGESRHNNDVLSSDYIIVYSYKDDPSTIMTFFLIGDPGSLQYYDLTEDYYQIMSDKNIKKYSGAKVREKFIKRQQKKQK